MTCPTCGRLSRYPGLCLECLTAPASNDTRKVYCAGNECYEVLPINEMKEICFNLFCPKCAAEVDAELDQIDRERKDEEARLR